MNKIKNLILISFIFFSGCAASRKPVLAEEPAESKLRLFLGRGDAKFMLYVQPTVVGLTGRLSEGLDLPDFYCAIIEWDFGDGTRSINEPSLNCDGVQRVFWKQHIYRFYGKYVARLTLKHSTSRLILATDTVEIEIRETNEERGME